MKSKKIANSASNTVAANLVNTRAYRENVALSFLASLRALLGDSTTPIQDSLIAAAVSAHVEVVVTSEQFLRARAAKGSMGRLSIARGSLIRSLRALGLITGNVEPEDAPPPAPMGLTVEQVAADIIRARRPAESETAADAVATTAS